MAFDPFLSLIFNFQTSDFQQSPSCDTRGREAISRSKEVDSGDLSSVVKDHAPRNSGDLADAAP